jgi:hypothetical protein
MEPVADIGNAGSNRIGWQTSDLLASSLAGFRQLAKSCTNATSLIKGKQVSKAREVRFESATS